MLCDGFLGLCYDFKRTVVMRNERETVDPLFTLFETMATWRRRQQSFMAEQGVSVNNNRMVTHRR